MAFDIRAIFSRALGGRPDATSSTLLPAPAPESTTDEEMPGSPVMAAGSAAASPDVDDMTMGGATAATALIPEGVGAAPSASIDVTSAREDDEVADDQARAVAEVAIAAALASGPLTDEERADVLETLAEVPGLAGFGDDELDEVVARLEDGADEADSHAEAVVSNLEDRLDELSTTLSDPALRRAAFQLAVYFAAWDGALSDEERDLLDTLTEAFEIDAQQARELRDATLIESWPESAGEQRLTL